MAKAKKKTKGSTKSKAAKSKKATVDKKKGMGAKKNVSKQPQETTEPAAKTKKSDSKKGKKAAADTASAEKRTGRSKVLPRDFMLEMAATIRKAVLPHVQQVKGREVVGSASSGDATFQLDKIAEKALLTFLREAKKPVAYYSEDAGYATFTSGQPEYLLVVDPIDGTRAAKSGFEACVVSVSSTRVIERPRIADVDNGCIMEITQPRSFYAERGKGARMYLSGKYKKPKLSSNADLETIAWSMTVPARPAELIFPTAAKLIDLSSLKGGFFACNSTSYSLTRLLTNQLDGCVDFANRFFRDMSDMIEDHFINAGRGAVLGIAPYDIAASVLIAQEAGCKVSDAYGQGFDDMLLLDCSVANQQSLIAAANPELYEKLFSFFDIRIRQFEQLLERRASLS